MRALRDGARSVVEQPIRRAAAELLKAVELDPDVRHRLPEPRRRSRNLGRLQDAENYINEALKYLDGMTERERYNTRGMYFRLTGDYQQCANAYGELIARYAADVVGHNQLASCLIRSCDDPRGRGGDAAGGGASCPTCALFRTNLSWYASYAGDFPNGGGAGAGDRDRTDVYSRTRSPSPRWGRPGGSGRRSYEGLKLVRAGGRVDGGIGSGRRCGAAGSILDAIRLLEDGDRSGSEDRASIGRPAAKFVSLAHVAPVAGQSASRVTPRPNGR